MLSIAFDIDWPLSVTIVLSASAEFLVLISLLSKFSIGLLTLFD